MENKHTQGKWFTDKSQGARKIFEKGMLPMFSAIVYLDAPMQTRA